MAELLLIELTCLLICNNPAFSNPSSMLARTSDLPYASYIIYQIIHLSVNNFNITKEFTHSIF